MLGGPGAAIGWANPTAALGVDPDTAALFETLRQFPLPSGQTSDFYRRVDLDNLITDEAVSSTAMTLPSLWFSRDGLPPQLGSNRLIRSWLAYQSDNDGFAAVDVVVNSQIWRALTYGERFAVLTRFAATTEAYGYNLRLLRGNTFNLQIVGIYACNSTLPTPPPTPTCQASIDPFALTTPPAPPTP